MQVYVKANRADLAVIYFYSSMNVGVGLLGAWHARRCT